MRRTITNFLVGTLPHVRVGDAHSHSWVDTGVAQGRVLSHLLFSLLVNRVATDIRRCCPRVRLHHSSSLKFVCQLYIHLTWSFLHTRRRICSLGSTQFPIGDVSGDSPLASALISSQSWCLVRRDKCPLAQSRWTASISQWYALTNTSASFWRHHYERPTTSTISPLAASGCLHKPQLGREARISQFLSVVSYWPPTCRAQRLDWSLQSRALRQCLSSIHDSEGGVVIYCGGQGALLMRRSSAN